MINDLDKEIKKVLIELTYERYTFIIASVLFGIIFFCRNNLFIFILGIIFIIAYLFIAFYIIYFKINEELQLKKIINILKKYNINTKEKIDNLRQFNSERKEHLSAIEIGCFLFTILSVILSVSVDYEESILVYTLILIGEILIIAYLAKKLYYNFSNQAYINKLNDILFYLSVNFESYFKNRCSIIEKIKKLFKYLK